MDKKRRKKDLYKKRHQDTKRAIEIDDGLKGFLITCNTGTEKRWIKEAFNVLNEFTEKLYPNLEEQKDQYVQEQEKIKAQLALDKKKELQDANTNTPIKSEHVEATVEPTPTNQVEESTKTEEPECKTISQLINDEISNLKTDQIFYVFPLKLNSLVFIKISDNYKTLIDPNLVTSEIFKHILETQKPLTRFWLRFMPIIFAWKAKSLYKNLHREIPAFFQKLDGVKWSMEFKCRNNNSIKRQDCLDVVYNDINTTGSGNSVDLTNPQYSVIVEVMMDIALVGVAEKFKVSLLKTNFHLGVQEVQYFVVSTIKNRKHTQIHR